MKDNEIRGLLLQRYYERRREGMINLEPSEFEDRISKQDINHVSIQLLDHCLIAGKKIESMGEGLVEVMARITASGVDVVEGTARAPISIHLTEDKSINISGSHGVIIGDSNTQTVSVEVEKLVQAIEQSGGSETDKAEAKSRLRRFLEHPLVAAVAGGAVGLISTSAK